MQIFGKSKLVEMQNHVLPPGRNVGEQTRGGVCGEGCTRSPVAVVDAVDMANVFDLQSSKLVRTSRCFV